MNFIPCTSSDTFALVSLILGAFLAERLCLSAYCHKMKLVSRKIQTRVAMVEARDLDQSRLSSDSTSRKVKMWIMNFMMSYSWHAAKRDSKVASHRIRNFFFSKIFAMNMEKGSNVYNSVEVICPWNITLGENSIIGIGNIFDGRGGIIVGKNVNFGHQVHVWTGQHDYQSPDFAYVQKSVVVNDRAWISSRVTILPGVTIGEGAVIAAGSVLTKDADPFGVYAGIPAKKIGERNKSLIYTLGDMPHFL